MLENIPAEMRAVPQWVAAGDDKKPINPRTGRFADPSDHTTGGTFAEAVACGKDHIGFILSPSDPWAIIDLDNPFERIVTKATATTPAVKAPILPGDPDYPEAKKIADQHSVIYRAFPTYAERSQSGKGIHLVMRGSLPCGVRRDKVELYSAERYMIFTGDVLRNSPITDCQDLLGELFSRIGRLIDDRGELIEEDQAHDDSVIWKRATAAATGERFIELCRGNWEGMGYPSQSEADFALCSYLCFFSRCNEQVIRMFRQTKLGQRDKAQREAYFRGRYGILTKIRNREPKLVDISGIQSVATAEPEQFELPGMPAPEPVLLQAGPPEVLPTMEPPPQMPDGSIPFPPGLVGEMAQYFFSAAARPVSDIALAAAIAFSAGIAGRTWNISGTGLNQYVILLAKTGRGKDGGASGIDLIVNAVRETAPTVERYVGPSAFASGPALIRFLDEKPSFCAVLGEIGASLKIMCSTKASEAQMMLSRILLDVYMRSGYKKTLRQSVYSDSEKNTKTIISPAVSIFGESNPDTFFEALDESHISNGLVPRFMVFQYQGKRVGRNKRANHPPPPELVRKVVDLVSSATNMGYNATCQNVPMEDAAEKILDQLDLEADSRINSTESDVETELWNRAHLKALKLAALIAVGVNHQNPIVTVEVAEWAVMVIRREIGMMVHRFKVGDMGSPEAKQENEIKKWFARFQELTGEQRKHYRCPDALLDRMCCPFHYFNIYSKRAKVFVEDRRGPARALQDQLQNMVKSEVLQLIPLNQAVEQFGTRAPIYVKGPAWVN